MNRTRASSANTTQWFNSSSLFLNRMAPAFVHDYLRNRFWNVTDEETSNPFLNVRAGNAMHFDQFGRLVWARANLLARSNDMPGASWARSLVSITESTDFPSPTGDKVFLDVADNGAVLNGNNGDGGVSQSVTSQPNTAWFCYSIYARAGAAKSIRLREQATTGIRYIVNLLNGVATLEFGTPTNSIVQTENVGNGWWRVAWFYRTQSTTVNFSIKSGDNVGDGVSGFYMSSPQLELRGPDSPKEYLSTGTGVTALYRPRFDYDPQTLLARGYLVEMAKTNLLIRSETNLPTDWDNLNSCTATYTDDVWGRPISRITVTSAPASQYNFITTNSLTPSASTLHTLSGFFKRGNVDRVQFTTSTNFADAFMTYNFNTRTITLGGANVVANSGHDQILQNDWVRLQFSFTTIAVPTAGNGCIVSFADSDASGRLVGTSTNGAFYDCFGFQIETNGIASSYIPTFGAAGTRVSDLAILNPLPWLTQNKGTFFLELFSNKRDANLRRYIDMNDNTSNNRLQIARSSLAIYTGLSSVAGVTDYNPNTTPSMPNFQIDKVALRYNSSGKSIVCNNGTVVTTVTAPPVSGYTHLYVGLFQGLGDAASSMAWLRQIRYYADDTASNAQLQTLTT